MTFERDRLPDPVSYFEGVGLTLRGPGKWKTTECRFHGGSDSMRVNTGSGAWVCMACGAKGGDVLAYEMQSTGTEFVRAAQELGAWVDDGRPPPTTKPAALPPRAALSALAHETSLIYMEFCRMAKGITPTPDDVARMGQAAGTIQLIAGDYQQ
jgi:hypothetical protein